MTPSGIDAAALGSREEIWRVQLTKLRRMLEAIHGRNPFYTRKLATAGMRPADLVDPAVLSALPCTTKSELLEAQAEADFAGNLTYPLSRYIRFHQTSGTTGEPLRVLDTTWSWAWWGRCWAQVYRGAGVTGDDRIFLASSFGPFIGFWGALAGAERLGALMIPGGGRSSIDRLRLMRDTRSTVLCCTPSYALHLLEVAADNGIDAAELAVRTLILAGEPGANVTAIRQRIERGWNAHCRDHAGASEVGAFAVETTARPGGLTVLESEFIAEIIDPASGVAAAPGARGELVMTNLGRWGFPVIRYRTGDVVTAGSADPASGPLLYLAGGVIGRIDDMITVRGVNIFPSAIDNLVRTQSAVAEYRVTVDKLRDMAELTVEIELVAGAADERVAHSLAQLLTDKLGLRAAVNLVAYGTLPRFEHKGSRFRVR